ncbi:Deoxyadenosine/deoxycytidine kinase [Ekhidna lutea]|uniref:Deoxyadenosine/deoxycytidine kinase n=1 Tax=Ekhidna lutea TaxID=447679 RepID=A0A239KK59_EKHLU|nr:deoxynucleoside kinase [Ekhidna lutea]SNT18756.1 Deoxyadenosine/deoxycytidine kinase [Ekhidna lutea]
MHIAVSGNIGAGKTTLTEMLAKHYGWQAEFESVEDNPYLEDFYGDMHKWAFHLQVYFLNSRFEQINKLRGGDKTIIQDRTIYEDAYIFAESLYKQGFFKERDYNNYRALFDSMIEFVKPPDLLIYLKSDISKLVKNIETRGRDYENLIRIEYLKGLNEHYENWIANYDAGKLLIINVTDLDFVKNPEDFSDIVFKIDTELHGLFS